MSDHSPNPRAAARGPVGSAVRSLLLLPLPPNGTRIVDMIVLALVVCLPILAMTLLGGAVVGLGLQAVGAPDALVAIPGLAGLGSGLVLGFLVLLRVYMRVPAAIRSWVTPDDQDGDERGGLAMPHDDPAANPSTLVARVAASDAAFAPDPPESRQRGDPS
jgi:hypothetical protein